MVTYLILSMSGSVPSIKLKGEGVSSTERSWKRNRQVIQEKRRATSARAGVGVMVPRSCHTPYLTESIPSAL